MESFGFALVDDDIPEFLPLEIIHISGSDSFHEFLLFYWESVEFKLSVDQARYFLFQ